MAKGARAARVLQVTARWGQTTLGVWRADRSTGFRVGDDARCDFAVAAEPRFVIAPDRAVVEPEVRVNDVVFEIEVIPDDARSDTRRRQHLSLMSVCFIASFALHAVTAWTLHRARPAPEAVDPSTGLGASQLAAIKGYLARAAERDVEPDEPVEDIAVPSFRMPLLATAWGARALACRYDEECVASGARDGDCCDPPCSTPNVYSASFARALEDQWAAACSPRACNPGDVQLKCPRDESAPIPWCSDGVCVDWRRAVGDRDRPPLERADYEELRSFMSESERARYLVNSTRHDPAPSGDPLEEERAVLALMTDGGGGWLLRADPGPLPEPTTRRGPGDNVRVSVRSAGVWGHWKEPELTAALQNALGHFRACYERERATDPSDDGYVVVVRLLHNRDGSVEVRPGESPAVNPPSTLARCVMASIRRLDLPRANGSAEAMVGVHFFHTRLQ